MEIIVSKRSGFCFGVKRAVNLTRKNLKDKKKIFSLGPLIHNKRVVSELAKEGLKIIKNLSAIKEGYCVIPSHGVNPNRIKDSRISFIDTTCPFVFKAQSLIKNLADSGYEILIIGDRNHPEVKGLIGISKGRAKVLATDKEIRYVPSRRSRLSVVSQTTQSLENFRAVIAKLLEKDFQELRIFNTVCRDAIHRQEEARAIAKKVDLILVLGGKDSANTKRLAEVCRPFTRTHHIESEKEIEKAWFKNVNKVGIVTGASTPGELIGKVKIKINRIGKLFLLKED